MIKYEMNPEEVKLAIRAHALHRLREKGLKNVEDVEVTIKVTQTGDMYDNVTGYSVSATACLKEG